MLTIKVPKTEGLFDELNEQFIETIPEFTLMLEHSLVAIAKWESRYHKPFISRTEEKTMDETLYYIECMTLNKVNTEYYSKIPGDIIKKINEYIENPMTATIIRRAEPLSGDKKKNTTFTTSEQIYSQMIDLQIPPEYQKWHINRLLVLIEIRINTMQPQKKMSGREAMRHNAAINKAQRTRFRTRG